jgi:hypothetical protein
MRSPIGPILLILGLATTLVVVLLLVQLTGLRSDLHRAEERVATLQAEVEGQEAGVSPEQLRRELDELKSWTRSWLIATQPGPGANIGTPAGGDDGDGGSRGDDADYATLVRRIDQVLERIEALDARVDDICEGVPVC